MNDVLEAARAKIADLENQLAAVSARLAQVTMWHLLELALSAPNSPEESGARSAPRRADQS